MTVSENFVNLILSSLKIGPGFTDSAKMRNICEISPAFLVSINSLNPRISRYETAERTYYTVFGVKCPYNNSQVV